MNGPDGNVSPSLADKNTALQDLSPYVEQLMWVKEKCMSLWHLHFLAYPRSGGYAYFSAAIASECTQMLIVDTHLTIHGPQQTETWISNFDPDTGIIHDGELLNLMMEHGSFAE